MAKSNSMADPARVLGEAFMAAIAPISAIAEKFRPVEHADTVFQSMPVWGKAETVRYFYGINRPQLVRLVCEGKVCAKKVVDLRGGSVIFRLADVANAIDEMTDMAAPAASDDEGDAMRTIGMTEKGTAR